MADWTPVWDGITRGDILTEEGLRDRMAFADAARTFEWPRVFEFLASFPDWINVTRPGGTSRFAPLHQAAYGGAPRDVVEHLVALGAWLTLRNARGQRPIDLVDWRRHPTLVGPLEPRLRHAVPADVLQRLQAHFHGVIRGRVDDLLTRYEVRLPELEPLLELRDPEIWFAVPGMYGGFRYRLEGTGTDARLVTESFAVSRAARASVTRSRRTGADWWLKASSSCGELPHRAAYPGARAPPGSRAR